MKVGRQVAGKPRVLCYPRREYVGMVGVGWVECYWGSRDYENGRTAIGFGDPGLCR